VLLPEGEIVTIDRIQTGAASRNAFVNFHANTGGTLKLDASGVASGTVGGSAVAIHPVLLSGGKPTLVKPPVGSCTVSCSYPCGSCTAGRYATDVYSLTIPGSWAVAIHVIDGLAAGEKPAQVDSLSDGAVIGAAVARGSRQSFVVASSAENGKAGATLG